MTSNNLRNQNTQFNNFFDVDSSGKLICNSNTTYFPAINTDTITANTQVISNIVISNYSVNGEVNATGDVIAYISSGSPISLQNVSNLLTITTNSRLSSIEGINLTQNSRLDANDILNNTQNSRLDGIDILNNTQNSRLDGVEAVNLTQTSRLDGIDILNTTQNSRLGNLENIVTGTSNLIINLDSINEKTQNINATTTE